MDVVLMAGGQGTRLRPYTLVLPKPLMPIAEIPVMEVLLRQLGRIGVSRVVLAVGYLSEIIFAYLEPRRHLYPFRLELVTEPERRGTVGALKQVTGLEETFLVMNGDIITTLPFLDLVAFHKERGARMTIATSRREVKIDYGVLEVDASRNIVGQSEKPSYYFDVSMGIYVLEPELLERIPGDRPWDIPDLIKVLIEDGQRVCSYQSDCYWLDIGREDDYEVAVEDFQRMRGQLLCE